MHWQCPAALAALGICYKLVKAVCLQTTLIYPRVSVRHSTNHRSRKRLSWFLLFSPNPQMYFVLSDNGRSTEPEAGTPGQCKHCGKPVCGSSWLWVSGKQRQGMTKGKGNRKRAKRTTHNAMFGTKTCCCFSKAAGSAAGDRGHTLFSDCSLELKSINAGLNDSTLPPAGLHTPVLLLSQSSEVMHYLAQRCF